MLHETVGGTSYFVVLQAQAVSIDGLCWALRHVDTLQGHISQSVTSILPCSGLSATNTLGGSEVCTNELPDDAKKLRQTDRALARLHPWSAS